MNRPASLSLDLPPLAGLVLKKDIVSKVLYISSEAFP